MRRLSLLSALVFAVSVAACSGSAPTGLTTPPQDTTTHVTSPAAVLDSLWWAFVRSDGSVYHYADRDSILLNNGLPSGAIGLVPSPGLLAFTSRGLFSEVNSIAALFGGVTLSSDNPAILTPVSGDCGPYPGAGCLMLKGGSGVVHLTASTGGKSITILVRVH